MLTEEWELLKMLVSEIHVKRIRINQGLGSITCALTSFFFELSHVICLKLTRVIQECLLSLNELNDFFLQFYKKKTIWHLEIWQN
jgi:hypothetical protein